MSWQELILTVLFSLYINMVMDYLETNPGYSCPVYCEVDHSHFRNNPDIVYFTVVDPDSLFWIALPDSDSLVGILKD